MLRICREEFKINDKQMLRQSKILFIRFKMFGKFRQKLLIPVSYDITLWRSLFIFAYSYVSLSSDDHL